MPKTTIDYSNTIIYKITCNDSTVRDTYVGHTTNFVQRKHAHKQSCINIKSINYKCKLYENIRNNGGWSNWKMEIINFFNCRNQYEARQKEQEYFLLLNANLNSIEPLPPSKLLPIKQQTTTNLCSECSNKFVCLLCDYSTSRKSQYERHIGSTKHTTNILKSSAINGKNVPSKIYKCECNKVYNDRAGLWRHRKKCFPQSVEPAIVETNIENKFIHVPVQSPIEPIYNNILCEILKQNQEFRELMLDQNNKIFEQNEKIIELSGKIGNTPNNIKI
jgi:hypothetical protein